MPSTDVAYEKKGIFKHCRQPPAKKQLKEEGKRTRSKGPENTERLQDDKIPCEDKSDQSKTKSSNPNSHKDFAFANQNKSDSLRQTTLNSNQNQETKLAAPS